MTSLIIQDLKKTMPTSVDVINQIINFITINKNIPTDYYLSLPSRTLSRFQGTTLHLQPYINTYKPATSK